jgi:hypothetical protein
MSITFTTTQSLLLCTCQGTPPDPKQPIVSWKCWVALAKAVIGKRGLQDDTFPRRHFSSINPKLADRFTLDESVPGAHYTIPSGSKLYDATAAVGDFMLKQEQENKDKNGDPAKKRQAAEWIEICGDNYVVIKEQLGYLPKLATGPMISGRRETW